MSVRPDANGRGDHTGKIELATHIAVRAGRAIKLIHVIMGAFVASVMIGAWVTLKYVHVASAAKVEQLDLGQAQLGQKVDDHIASTDARMDRMERKIDRLLEIMAPIAPMPPPAKRR